MEQRFPMEQGVLRCRQVGDRAELTMEVPGPGQGLYRGYALGEGGQMDLGTLLPEGGGPLWRERPRRVRPPACRRCRAGSTAPGRPEVPRGCLAR